MLGRRPPKDAKIRPAAVVANTSTGRQSAFSKKRKWQESDDEESDEKITKDDMEKWKATMREEEKQEQMERERQEHEEREQSRLRLEAEERERRRKEEEDAQAQKEVEEARRVAEEVEAERRRQEDGTQGFALAHDLPSVMPAGIAPGKEHLYKTSYCKRWEQGNCNFGSACHFAHGERELRGKPPKGSPPGTLSVPLPPDVPRPQSTRALDPQVTAPLAAPPQVTVPQVVLPPQMQQPATSGGPVVVLPPHLAGSGLDPAAVLAAAAAVKTASGAVGPGAGATGAAADPISVGTGTASGASRPEAVAHFVGMLGAKGSARGGKGTAASTTWDASASWEAGRDAATSVGWEDAWNEWSDWNDWNE